LDTPAPSIKLPVGAYKLSEIWLQHGSTRALRRPQESVNITESAGASLVVGGPLNHSMDLERSRDQIVLRHKVVGVDRNSYWLTPLNRNNPPTWAVYQGPVQIASGQFVYG
jgi:hypothetical protein